MTVPLGREIGLAFCILLGGVTVNHSWGKDHDALRPGDILNQDNWQKAEDLLPPEILRHYARGEYANPILEWPNGRVQWGREFLEATEANRGRFAVNERGTIIDKVTRQQPRFIYGFPFPHIDRADPQAGVKILWNYYYGYWSNGSRRNVSVLMWLNPGGIDRDAVTDVYFFQYDGQPEKYRPKENPHNLLQQFLATTLRPTDLYGTTALTWRYRDADKRDSNWAYVPALRRVRQVSPANRSDGFLGSDMSQDDGPFFDGKPEDFTWRLVEGKEAFRLADPYSLKGEFTCMPLAGGGWRVPFKNVPMVGFQDPSWKGVAWAPVNFVLVKRPFWIIEGVPRDRYYLFGKIELYIDQENYRGAWSRKFDWRGELVNTYQIGAYLNYSPNGEVYFWGHGLYYQLAENLKRHQATFAGPPPSEMLDAPNDFFVPYEPGFFNVDTLVRFGK